MPRSQSAAVNSAQPRMVADEKPITESNLRFCARARVPADLAASPGRSTCRPSRARTGVLCAAGQGLLEHLRPLPLGLMDQRTPGVAGRRWAQAGPGA